MWIIAANHLVQVQVQNNCLNGSSCFVLGESGDFGKDTHTYIGGLDGWAGLEGDGVLWLSCLFLFGVLLL